MQMSNTVIMRLYHSPSDRIGWSAEIRLTIDRVKPTDQPIRFRTTYFVQGSELFEHFFAGCACEKVFNCISSAFEPVDFFDNQTDYAPLSEVPFNRPVPLS